MVINLLISILHLDIVDICFKDIKTLENITEYKFSLIKCICTLSNLANFDIYFRIIKKGKIKESLFCYWYLLYEEELVKSEQKTLFSSIINKVLISEIDKERYKNSVFLEIDNNTSDILKFGTEVHFIDFFKYIEHNISYNLELEGWLNYLDKSSEDFLMIGVVNNQDIGRSNFSIV